MYERADDYWTSVVDKSLKARIGVKLEQSMKQLLSHAIKPISVTVSAEVAAKIEGATKNSDYHIRKTKTGVPIMDSRKNPLVEPSFHWLKSIRSVSHEVLKRTVAPTVSAASSTNIGARSQKMHILHMILCTAKGN